MRIRELFEGKDFDDSEFTDDTGERAYDLAEDLVFFMNNDDDVYRRHVYPIIIKCVNRVEAGLDTSPSIFKNAVKECYKLYIKKYPSRDLEDSLEPELFNDTCKKIYEEVYNDIEEGKYKD